MRTRKARGLFVACLLLGAGLRAQTIAVVDPACLPRDGNGVIHATVFSPSGVAQAPRIYFREKGQQAFYWVPMEAEPGGQYWTVLPRPERQNPEVEYYGTVVDAAGKPLARSESKSVRITTCDLKLSPKEKGLSENLTVGETSPSQYKKKVTGFLCPGLKIRIDPQGVKRADEECGPCGLAWLTPALAGAGAVLGVIITDDPEPSPSRP
jgi:hypothetical protein